MDSCSSNALAHVCLLSVRALTRDEMMPAAYLVMGLQCGGSDGYPGISANPALWVRQEDDIDIDCGGVIDGTSSVDQLRAAIFRHMLDCASGNRSKSELHGYGQNEFVPWQVGVIT